MDCPKCKSTSHIKDGQVGGRQRHRCKKCDFRYTVLERGKPMATKKLALQLYLEGLGFRSIGRVLKVSAVSVMNWIKLFGMIACETAELTADAPIIELDEIHTYVGEKKTTFGFGRQLTASQKSSLISRLEVVAFKREKGCTKI